MVQKNHKGMSKPIDIVEVFFYFVKRIELKFKSRQFFSKLLSIKSIKGEQRRKCRKLRKNEKYLGCYTKSV